MFNDILTGKASLETPPALPPSTSPPAAWAPPSDASARAYAESMRQIRRSQGTQRALRIGVVVATCLGLGAIKVAMRRQYNEDMRVANGGDRDGAAAYDPFVSQVSGYASQLCACSDSRCAWSVQGQFNTWLRAQTTPTDDAVLDAAARETARYSECLARLQKP